MLCRFVLPPHIEMRLPHASPTEIEVHVSGNVAWAIFRYTLMAENNNRVADVVGRGIAILERSQNRWVVRHTHTSGRARRPTDPPAN